ncbi:RNA-directed DNA polymerase [Chryseobacterium sp. H3056]|uniref:RNA-directed DNA polymerase n=1 Tax=Kaistella daneshvariae TaxID=2487074 RepID=A0A3N0WXL6_9FLAO|nr:reverse transcriptase family protein [Kaistella daneshvariae]ROI09826.1 RNA-directed DNA polymerase [Kaistella daneshvariae]
MRTRLTEEQKEVIKDQTALLQSKSDFVALLNDVAVMIYGDDGKKAFHLKHLTYYGNPKISSKRYATFEIKKKSGKTRIIHSPSSGLKSILKCFRYVLESVYEPHPAAMGFAPGRSVVDNAQKHVQMLYVYNIDLQDFFHNFDRNRVKMGLWRNLFNVEKNKEELSFFLAALCTHPIEINGEVKIVLPQGSPVSPVLTNMLCVSLDRRLQGLAKRYRIRYSRYADDITFSSNRNVFVETEFQLELHRIIEEDQKLKINPDKTRLQKRGYRQEVTGVIVNEKLNVHRKYVKQVRMWLYYMEKYGPEKAEQLFRADYIREKSHVKNITNPMLSVLIGKLQYLKMVKGQHDPTYLSLLNRFTKLLDKSNFPLRQKSTDLADKSAMLKNKNIIDLIIELGVEKALQNYVINE